MPEFTPWPKTPRLFREMVITEKLDGTNAAIIITPDGADEDNHVALAQYRHDETGEHWFQLCAQSRTRLITPDRDNHGFARWVRENAKTLAEDLGIGTHFGEWWGQGINRGYGLKEKRFSLFNVSKWQDARDIFTTPQLSVVPVLARDGFDTCIVDDTMYRLEHHGSVAAPGFMNPEGICVYHEAARKVFKYTLNGDGYKG